MPDFAAHTIELCDLVTAITRRLQTATLNELRLLDLITLRLNHLHWQRAAGVLDAVLQDALDDIVAERGQAERAPEIERDETVVVDVEADGAR